MIRFWKLKCEISAHDFYKQFQFGEISLQFVTMLGRKCQF